MSNQPAKAAACDHAQTELFLGAAFPVGIPDGLWLPVIHISGSAPKSKIGVLWASVDQPLHCLPRDENVYVAVALQPEAFGGNRRGTNETAAGIYAVGIDVDIAGAVHGAKKPYPPDIAAALIVIHAAGVKPTIVVNTGYGLQAWWMLDECWVFCNDDERQQAAAMFAGWVRLFQKHAMDKGRWVIDSTVDLARVLRLPGTFNVKVADDPKPVVIVERNDATVTRDQILELIGEVAAVEKMAPVVDIGPLKLDPNAQPDFDRWNAIVAENPILIETWDHKRKEFKDQTLSSYDMALASSAARAGWPDQLIANLIIAHRRKYNSVEKALRLDYVQRTILKAKSDAREITSLEAIREAAPDDETDRDQMLEHISNVLGTRIVNIVKYQSEPPFYKIVTSSGEITVRGAKVLISQDALRVAIAEAQGHLLNPLKPKDWHLVSQRLLNACELQDAGEETRPTGWARITFDEYINANPPAEEDHSDEAIRRKRPFVKSGTIHVFNSHFREWVGGYPKMVKMNAIEVGLMFKRVGADPTTVRFGSSTRYCYRLSGDLAVLP